MNLLEIRAIAKTYGIHLVKTELIKSIQRSEGNFDCFATAYAGELRSRRLLLA
jgi:hypothetical protein